MKKNLAFMSLAMMAMMSETNFGEIPKETLREYEPRKEPKQVIPKGCKEYHFDKDGNYPNQWGINNGESIFNCIASNDKVAFRKFENFIKKREYSNPA